MIDAHLHVVPPNLPGVGSLSPLLEREVNAIAATLREEMQAAGVTQALAMGSWQAGESDPLGVSATLRIAQQVPGLHAIGVADPTRTEPEFLRAADDLLATGRVKALKAYLGYLHFGPDHPGYRPWYEMAERHHLPVVFHTGDTYSPWAKVRFAHPLLVDDVAVDHPRVRFVLAHVGNPWMLDAAEVVYKNMNVWADLSGLVVGDFADPEQWQEARLDIVDRLAKAIRYAERPNRFLYGTDWPLVPMTAYRDFIRTAVPELFHELFFEENAKALFRI